MHTTGGYLSLENFRRAIWNCGTRMLDDHRLSVVYWRGVQRSGGSALESAGNCAAVHWCSTGSISIKGLLPYNHSYQSYYLFTICIVMLPLTEVFPSSSHAIKNCFSDEIDRCLLHYNMAGTNLYEIGTASRLPKESH